MPYGKENCSLKTYLNVFPWTTTAGEDELFRPAFSHGHFSEDITFGSYIFGLPYPKKAVVYPFIHKFNYCYETQVF